MNFEDIETPLTKEYIFSKLNVLDLWRVYSNFQEIDKSFTSQLYKDKHPSCRVVVSSNGNLYYKDYGENSHYFGDIFEYLMFKYNCSYFESLNIICSDFSIRDIKVNKEVKELILESDGVKVEKLVKVKSDITSINQNFNLNDFNYWNSFGVSFDTLGKGECFSTKSIQIIKNNNRYIYQYKKLNPIYKYVEYDIDENYIGNRWYFPNEKKERKWINNSSSEAIQGIKLLPKNGDLLILSKSFKDSALMYELGYNCCSLASETVHLSETQYNNLIGRFDNIISFYDNDETGYKYSQYNLDNWNIFRIFVPEKSGCKDITDFYKKFGKEKSIKLLKELL